MSESEKNEPKDWREYERRGVPVLDFLLHVMGEDADAFRTNTDVVDRVEQLAELWLRHHPEKELTATTFSVQHEVARPIPSETTASHLVPACGHTSEKGIDGKVHVCFLPQNHEQAGIAHEDETMKWYRAQPKPFKKVAG